MKKILCAIFSRIIECDKTQWTIWTGLKYNLTFTVGPIGAYFLDLSGCWKHEFLKKKGNLSSEKSIVACFLSYYRMWQTSRDSL